ncbi:aminobenzoyl-glutamate transport protein [Paraperlucidibaca baekdonensis]|uniref:Aminobenzoyl-glutamate transport protein n=1 Tax=Paraperlucidibaca baekdonensis TaxID=748120 RepID=A0A3E0H799_9GAMM|nr:AbgT family transporter [Paraperlucidibaca baekdonensis]REH38944.1 aminobenzoyl-glutamate transport protein [Paraperlucidibaca baekdonensis]
MSTSVLHRSLDHLERLGNRLPHPTWLFVWLCFLVAIISAIAAGLDWQAPWPDGSRTVSATSLISLDGLRYILTSSITNFTQFAPVGSVMIAMLGLGLAERSGLLGGLLSGLVRLSGGRGLAFIVAFAGVLSSLAVDAGYVVIIPLAGLLFARAGLPPLAGIACAFAGVSAGFSANIAIGPVDAILAGITTEAARTVNPEANVAITANYYFIAASTLLVTLVISAVNAWLVQPRLQAAEQQLAAGALTQPDLDAQRISPSAGGNTTVLADADTDHHLHRAGALAALLWTLLIACACLYALWPADGALRGADGSISRSPLVQGIVVVIAFTAGVAGILYARFSGRWSRASDSVAAMEDTFKTLASYLVLMFFAAQFVAWFNWSQLGQLLAISGAEALAHTTLSATALLLLFLLATFIINLFIGSASAKWALMAPVFVPMLLLAGIPAESTLAAFRVGDSVGNIITPLMPYFAMVVAFAQRYQPAAGVGTLVALMLPYSLTLLVIWGGFLGLWLSLGWPLGPAS